MFDVILDHRHVISAVNTTTMSASFSRSYKDYEFVEFMLCYLLFSLDMYAACMIMTCMC